MKRCAFSSKHIHRQSAYFTGGYTFYDGVVSGIQLRDNRTIVAPDMNFARYQHSIASLNRKRLPDREFSGTVSDPKAHCLAYGE